METQPPFLSMLVCSHIVGEKHKLEALRQSQADLRATLSEQLDCSDEELYRMIQDFQRNLESMEAEQEKVKREKGWDSRRGCHRIGYILGERICRLNIE